MATGNSGLEFFLLRTLVRIERKFQPGKAKLVYTPVGTYADDPGEIFVRKSDDLRSKFEFTTIPFCDFDFHEISASNLGLSFTHAIYEPYQPTQGSNLTSETKPFMAGTWKFRKEFESGPHLEVIMDVELIDHYSWMGRINSNLFAQVQTWNLNRLMLTEKSGANRCYVLLGNSLVLVESFCPKVILSTLSLVEPEGACKHTESNISRALTYFWINEAYLYRLVAQEVHKYSYPSFVNGQQKVDNALRFLIDQMFETRHVINELIVRLFLEVAAELDICHPAVLKSQIIEQHLKTLSDYKNMPSLDSQVLIQLSQMDLRTVLPVFQSQLDKMYTEIGDRFEFRFRQRYDSQDTVRAVPDLLDVCNRNPYPALAKLILLKIHQLACSGRTLSNEPLNETDSGIHPSPKIVRLTSNNTAPSVPGYEAVLFRAMPAVHAHLLACPGTSLDKKYTLMHLKHLFSTAKGFLLKGLTLLCWQTISQEGLTQTFVHLANLRALERISLGPDAENRSSFKDWLESHTLPLVQHDYQIFDYVSGALYLLNHASNRILLRVFTFQPQLLERTYELTHLMDRCQYLEYFVSPRERYHFKKAFSPAFKMLLLAVVGSGISILDEITDSPKLCILLRAIAIRQPNQVVEVAVNQFNALELPWELRVPREFSTYVGSQGISPSSFNLPYSPIRWNTSRKNIYCIWLLAPESHIVFGLFKDRFVELSRRIAHRSLCTDLPFVLPSMSADRINGMRELFTGKRVWDPDTKQSIIRIFQMRLKHG